MTNKCRQTRQSQDELIWGMNFASELATGCYYTCRSIGGDSQSTPLGDKALCIIAPIERYSGYRHFQRKKERVLSNHHCVDSVYFHTLLIIYLSVIERRICRREMSLFGSTSFGFAKNMMHDFQNPVLKS